MAILAIILLLPSPLAYAESPKDNGAGGTATSSATVSVNGTPVNIKANVANVDGNNVTVYVSGDYNKNKQYLFNPHITELHMVNNEVGALWNPTVAELPKTLDASIMKQAKIGILYDGWIDEECTGPTKPYGADRYGEVLGYDLYARMGEQYTGGTYNINGGLLVKSDPVSYAWAVMHIYMALGIIKVDVSATTQPVPKGYDVNQSPIVQALTMPMTAPYLKDGVTKVSATRTNPNDYLSIAKVDGLPSEQIDGHMSVADFCTLVAELMHVYGEPVLTDQETYMLLEAYGRTLPYGLPSNQLEAIKYLLARGVIDNELEWRSDITLDQAATILMRVKDKGSRLTFKEIKLTTDPNLLKLGYYPTTVSAIQAPITVLNDTQSYSAYTKYDYFVQCIPGLEFKSQSGYPSTPFICKGPDNADGMLEGTEYDGRVTISGQEFYHFRTDMKLDTISPSGKVYINTAVADDTPYMYALPNKGNKGGFYLFNGTVSEDTKGVIDSWVWQPLDSNGTSAPSEYCDYDRKNKDIQTANTQTSILNALNYGFNVQVYKDDLSKVSCIDNSNKTITLDKIKTKTNLKNKITIEPKESISKYANFMVRGCDNKNSLSEVFKCASGSTIKTFPALSKANDRYLVPIDYLKALGVVWNFSKTGDQSYYIGVKSMDSTENAKAVGKDKLLSNGTDPIAQYTDVYIGSSGTTSYVIRGTQLTLYPKDVPIMWEMNDGYYVDYAAILGIQKTVAFKTDDKGSVSLSEESQIDPVKMTLVYNANNVAGTNTPAHEWMPVVDVMDAAGNREPYIYAPITYPLANWLVIDNQMDMRSGVFSFYPTVGNGSSGSGAQALRDYLGVELGESHWGVNYTGGAALVSMSVVGDTTTFKLDKDVKYGDLLYNKELNAYLIRPTKLKAGATFDSFKNKSLTSIVQTEDGRFEDWNNNLYKTNGKWSSNYMIRLDSVGGTGVISDLFDISKWVGGNLPSASKQEPMEDWIPAPVGIPGLVGFSTPASKELAHSTSVTTYSGSACLARQGSGLSKKYNILGEPSGTELQYAIIHATPSQTWLQSAGFKFKYLASSPLGGAATTRPELKKGGAVSSFDWDQFFKDIGLQNADDWLTIAIIAALNILPRILMFFMFVLMALAMIADVKPWKIFCDKVIDPYKIITMGRQTVHTIKVKTVFLYSLIALILFGLFQNGTILNIIAWIARAVTGIMRR